MASPHRYKKRITMQGMYVIAEVIRNEEQFVVCRKEFFATRFFGIFMETSPNPEQLALMFFDAHVWADQRIVILKVKEE